MNTTTYERAKAYEYVSQKVKDFFEGKQKMYSDVKQTLEYLFPELVVSDDERIRKDIIEHFEDEIKTLSCKGEEYEAEVEELSKYIAWLEKQKEKSELDDYTKTNLDRAIQIIKNVKGTLIGYQTDDGIYECDEVIKTLEQILNCGFETIKQDDSKWSEEDEKMLGKCIDAASGYYSPEDKEKMKEWLKSLKPQPKQKWSDNDALKLQEIINCSEKGRLLSNGDIDWLKQLKLQFHWKPTQEQISCFKLAIDLFKMKVNDTIVQNYLDSLYEQLKKL